MLKKIDDKLSQSLKSTVVSSTEPIIKTKQRVFKVTGSQRSKPDDILSKILYARDNFE